MAQQAAKQSQHSPRHARASARCFLYLRSRHARGRGSWSLTSLRSLAACAESAAARKSKLLFYTCGTKPAFCV